MVELRDEEDGRIALLMDKGELSLAVEALMRAGYGLTPPSADGAEQPEAEAGEPEQPEAEAGEPEQPEAEAEEPEEPEDFEAEGEEPEEPEAEDEEPHGRNPVRRRGSRARRLRLTNGQSRTREPEAQKDKKEKRADG